MASTTNLLTTNDSPIPTTHPAHTADEPGPADVDSTVVSQHRTSEGTIVYTRTADGALQVRLQRPDTGETVLIRSYGAR